MKPSEFKTSLLVESYDEKNCWKLPKLLWCLWTEEDASKIFDLWRCLYDTSNYFGDSMFTVSLLCLFCFSNESAIFLNSYGCILFYKLFLRMIYVIFPLIYPNFLMRVDWLFPYSCIRSTTAKKTLLKQWKVKIVKLKWSLSLERILEVLKWMKNMSLKDRMKS